jgi:hypothetical protein
LIRNLIIRYLFLYLSCHSFLLFHFSSSFFLVLLLICMLVTQFVFVFHSSFRSSFIQSSTVVLRFILYLPSKTSKFVLYLFLPFDKSLSEILRNFHWRLVLQNSQHPKNSENTFLLLLIVIFDKFAYFLLNIFAVNIKTK